MLTTGKISTVMSLLCLTSSVYSSQDQPPSLTEEDLRRIATLNLCPRFGGACGASCQRYIVHRWRLPLCADSSAKCCIPDSAYQGARVNTETTTIQTTTTSTTTTTTALPPSNDNLERQEPTAWMTYPNSDNTLSNGNTPQDSVNTQISLPSLDECGQMNWPRRQKRIVGGSVSPPGSWPWLTALRSMFGAHTCSGALISQRWVVTAAHCFKQFALPTMWRMRVGEYDLLSADDTERDLSVANIFIYPGYMSRAATESNSTLYARYKHDLALVQLAEDARVEPICLPSGEVTEAEVQNSSDDSNLASRFRMNSLERNGECWVAGWGFTRDNNHVGQILRQVQDDVVDSEECGDMWNTPLERDVICFGNGTRGPCSGDSGGPLSCWLNNRWYLAGVVSWGTEDCNRGGYPSVFTRVSPYLNWLHGIIRQQERLQRQ